MREVEGFRVLFSQRSCGYRYQRNGCARTLTVSFANPTVTLRATNEILYNLLGSFPAWDFDPVPQSLFVIDEHMRTGTLNS
jgi:hypothetical protein